MKHWTKFLPEAGRPIKRRGEEQELALIRIVRLSEELKRAQDEYQANETALTDWVKSEWTEEEIRTAKAQAK